MTFRLILNLRSTVSAIKCHRIVSPFYRNVSSLTLHPCVPVRTQQQVCLFSSSTILHVRRRDKMETSLTEEVDEEEEDEQEEDTDTDQTEQEKIRNTIQQYKLPKGYRIIIKHLASLRLDLICSAGTGLGRSAMEDEFYGSKLRVNGEKSTKKAQQIKEGDIIDLVVSRVEGAKYISKRIIVYKVYEEKSLKNKVKVCLVAWRQGIEVDGSEWN